MVVTAMALCLDGKVLQDSQSRLDCKGSAKGATGLHSTLKICHST